MSLFLIELCGRKVVFAHVPKTGGTSIRQGRQLSKARLYEPAPEWDGLPAFGFVRDPYDRAESCWRDFRFLRKQTQLSLTDFLVENMTGHDVEDTTSAAHHLAPMTHPMHGLQHAEFIGRHETLQQDFDAFCHGMSIHLLPLPRRRAAGDAPRAEWTSVARRIVEDACHEDFHRYGYGRRP